MEIREVKAETLEGTSWAVLAAESATFCPPFFVCLFLSTRVEGIAILCHDDSTHPYRETQDEAS